MLIDRIKLTLIAGDGGRGAIAFARSKKPSGGDGGKGGSIFIEGTSHRQDLSNLVNNKKIKADDGENGGKEGRKGADGQDIVIKVPLTTVVLDQTGNELVKIENHGDSTLVAEGGRGGLGNINFRAGQVATLRKTLPPDPGDKLEATLEFRMQADIVFIGFPNAGKSSLLNALSNTKVKVAPYEFTTLQPHLGVSNGIVFMDFPGFIKGASEGKGLGDKYIQHAKNTKATGFIISLENDDLVKRYRELVTEIENLDENLSQKKRIVIFSKKDLLDEEEIEAKVDNFKNNIKEDIEIVVTSSYDRDSVLKLIELLRREL